MARNLHFLAVAMLVVFTTVLVAARADPGATSMPPRFSLNADPKEVLASYPLGRVGKQAAFVHHGKAHREFTLPNRRTAWLYDVGEKEWHRTYTLVFGTDDTVIDVLYYDHSRFSKYGLTALQVQTVQTRSQKPALGPGPPR